MKRLENKDIMHEYIIDPSVFKIFADILDSIKENSNELDQNKLEDDKNLNILKNQIKDLYTQSTISFKIINDILIRDYRKQIKIQIRKYCDPKFIENVGIKYLKNHMIEKPVKKSSITQSIPINYWKNITRSLFKTNNFSPVLTKIKNFYYKILDNRIEDELKKVPMEIDSLVKAEYTKKYYINPITFKEFLNLSKSNEKNKDFVESEKLRNDFRIALEKKKLKQQKEKQQDSFDEYKVFFDMDERELKRAKRKSKSRRKYSKKSRRRKYD